MSRGLLKEKNPDFNFFNFIYSFSTNSLLTKIRFYFSHITILRFILDDVVIATDIFFKRNII